MRTNRLESTAQRNTDVPQRHSGIRAGQLVLHTRSRGVGRGQQSVRVLAVHPLQQPDLVPCRFEFGIPRALSDGMVVDLLGSRVVAALHGLARLTLHLGLLGLNRLGIRVRRR